MWYFEETSGLCFMENNSVPKNRDERDSWARRLGGGGKSAGNENSRCPAGAAVCRCRTVVAVTCEATRVNRLIDETISSMSGVSIEFAQRPGLGISGHARLHAHDRARFHSIRHTPSTPVTWLQHQKTDTAVYCFLTLISPTCCWHSMKKRTKLELRNLNLLL